MSQVILGLLLSLAGSALASFGLSDSCSSEVLSKLSPVLGALPGVIYAWVSRVKQGDITNLGVRK